MPNFLRAFGDSVFIRQQRPEAKHKKTKLDFLRFVKKLRHSKSRTRNLPITVSGPDERTAVADLVALNAEIGFLYCSGGSPKNRYPRMEWIREAARVCRRSSLHICGGKARKELLADKLDVSPFERIQVNGLLCEELTERICEMYPHHQIITQHNESNWDLIAVESPNHSVLVDGSGGKGVVPDEWRPTETYKAVGFAGGLGPNNLASELHRIGQVASVGWWVDMENSLREDDWFSIDRAKRAVAIVEKWCATNNVIKLS